MKTDTVCISRLAEIDRGHSSRVGKLQLFQCGIEKFATGT